MTAVCCEGSREQLPGIAFVINDENTHAMQTTHSGKRSGTRICRRGQIFSLSDRSKRERNYKSRPGPFALAGCGNRSTVKFHERTHDGQAQSEAAVVTR